MKIRLHCATAADKGHVGLVFAVFGLLFGPVVALGEPIDFKIISLERTPPFASCGASAPATPQYVAIRSLKEWADRCELLNPQPATGPVDAKADPSKAQQRQAPVPAVDFDHYTLLIADAGGRPNAENFLVFTGVRDLGNSIVADVIEVSAGQDCVSLATVNPDLHAYALIPRTDKTIHFSISKAVRDCSTRKLVN
jgi:hypothetical protein